MKKLFKNLISITFLFVIAFLLFSCTTPSGGTHTHNFIDGVCDCGEVEQVEEIKYTVTFKDDKGKVIKTEKVVSGKDATAPEAPEKEGYIFVGWDVAFTNITKDTVVTALYEEAGPTDASEVQFLGKIYSYDGTEKEIVVEGRMPEGYTVAYESNKATEVGTYYSTAVISNAEGVVERTLKAVFKIEKADDEAFNEWLDDFLVLYFEEDQLSCNLLFANPEDYGLEHYEAAWMSYTPFTNEEALADFEEIYDELKTFEDSELSPNQQYSYDIIEDFCLTYIDFYTKDYTGLSMSYISSFGGRPADLPTYMTGYIFRNEQDVKDVISFIKSVKDAFPTYIDYAEDMIEIGRPISDTTIDEMNSYLQQVIDAGDEYYLNKYFEEKFASLEFLTKEQANAYTLEVQEALKGDFIQAHVDLKAGLEALKGNCEKEGYLAVAGDLGKEYFVHLLEDNLGYSEINMEEYIAYLDEKVEEAMDGIDFAMFMAGKLPSSDYNRFVSYASGSKGLIEKTPEEMLEYLKKFAPTIVPNLKTTPEIHISYMDDTVAEFSNAVAYYMNSALDSYDHEYITLNPLKLTDKTETLSTLAHEGYPGHLYSYVFAKESGIHEINKVMKNLTYGEGWATYVQLKLFEYIKANSAIKAVQYACDYLYFNELVSYLAYSRIDAGINYEGWTVTQVYTYMSELGFGVDMDTAKEMYNTLIEMPAEYPAYGFGMAKFRDLHIYAQKELGANYNEVDFNRAIQSRGWVPMEVLEELVEEYIVEQKTLYGIE